MAVPLTPRETIESWLQTLPNLGKKWNLSENSNASPGGSLYGKFMSAYSSLPSSQRETGLAFHGTSSTNINGICSQGFDPSKRGQHGQACGTGEYFSTDPQTSMGYSSQGKKMLVCELLLGKEGVHHTKSGTTIVTNNPDHVLPRFILDFNDS
jgi:hypothetical protein